MGLGLCPGLRGEEGVRQEQGAALIEIFQGRKGIGIAGEAENAVLRLNTIADGRHRMACFADANGAGTYGEGVAGGDIREFKIRGFGDDFAQGEASSTGA